MTTFESNAESALLTTTSNFFQIAFVDFQTCFTSFSTKPDCFVFAEICTGLHNKKHFSWGQFICVNLDINLHSHHDETEFSLWFSLFCFANHQFGASVLLFFNPAVQLVFVLTAGDVNCMHFVQLI